MRQLDTADHISDGIDSRHAGAEEFIHQNLAMIHLDRHLRCK